MNQFTPVDTPVAIDSFLAYWKPNALLLVESELWPNLVMSAARNGVCLYLSLIDVVFVWESYACICSWTSLYVI